MPKPQRKPKEIEAVKDQILHEAVALIVQRGLEGFSMRKLAARLGIAAKTIYNYFQNKDELYLVILTKGFAKLYDECSAAYHSHHSPIGRIQAMVRAYLDFGIKNANIYNLMFTWHVPKYKDYVGTLMEPTARIELETALRVAVLFIKAIKGCAHGIGSFSDEDARFFHIYFWTQIHGFIAGYNNALLDYMHENPILLKERILEMVEKNFIRELNEFN